MSGEVITALGGAVATIVVAVAFLYRIIKQIQAEVTKTHTLVNHDRGVLLSALEVSTEALAVSTKDPHHRHLADEAKRSNDAHKRLQAVVDAGAT